MEKQTFDISGMTCAACEAAVTRAVSKLDGVQSADVSLLSQSMKVEYDPKVVNTEEIEQAVADAGYGASLPQAASAGKPETAAQIWEQRSERIRKESEEKKTKLISSLILLCILLVFSMLPMLGVFTFLMDMEWMMVDSVIQMFLATLILFIQRDFFTHGFKTLFHGSPNMDTLVALGSSVSFIYGFYGLLVMAYGYGTMNHELIHSGMNALYFESAAMIVTLVSLGKYLEARSKSKTGDALAKLVELAPKTALARRDGRFVEIPVEDVQMGDLLKIVPGASIPVDGVVEEGSGTLDQSAITGESMPVEKSAGDDVMSASTNLNGSFVMKATRVGSDTTLSQIISLVDEAGNSKAPIARLADRVSGIFVPVVLSIAALTLIGWLIAGQSAGFALNCAISVLVISCPCALGLATPLAIMVATGKAAQYGVLVKSAGSLETLSKVNTVVLDKTGTITEGRPAVVSMTLFGQPGDEKDFLTIAAAAESGSEHPLAKAVCEEAEHEHLTLPAAKNFKAFGGRGLEAEVDGIHVLAGNMAFMEEEHIELLPDARQAAKQVAQKGGTPLFFAFNGVLRGIVGAADEVRTTSREAISMLRKDGIEVIMLTGDNARTAKAIASSLDVSDVISDVLPADKESVIRSLQEKGRIVAMVGDGINDAPALTRADVGFAIKSGTDIAIESADIVLMKNSLLDVVTAIELSRATMRNIKENLFWAFFYNLLGIPVAMGLLYPINGWLLNPMIGAAAMSFSSVTVCLNALRLRLFKPAAVPAEIRREDEKKSHEVELNWLALSAPAKAPASARQANQGAAHSGMSGSRMVLKAAPSKADESSAKTWSDAQPALQSALFTVKGMSCMNCVRHVTEALEELDGVENVKVTLDDQSALVLSSKTISADVFRKAIEEAGYETDPAEPFQTYELKDFVPAGQNQISEALSDLRKNDGDLSWAIWNNSQKSLLLAGRSLPDEQEIRNWTKIGNTETEYSEEGETMTLKIDGMSCMHCAARVEKALLGVPGVESAKVDLDNASATVTGKDLDAAAMAKAVTAAGYSVSAIED